MKIPDGTVFYMESTSFEYNIPGFYVVIKTVGPNIHFDRRWLLDENRCFTDLLYFKKQLETSKFKLLEPCVILEES